MLSLSVSVLVLVLGFVLFEDGASCCWVIVGFDITIWDREIEVVCFVDGDGDGDCGSGGGRGEAKGESMVQGRWIKDKLV